ncbi:MULTISPECIES: chemotaxis protein CheB [unclassified Novosphingobium]|uniref:chemotaxis protein CheB n=1 Tax=unclassified Novosphingobium TaxID=2644732 RepID=UPI001F1CF034|nr:MULTISPECIES: chemotaxis protein CheB [unclassified Novosphingobium]
MSEPGVSARRTPDAVVIGASAGAIQALLHILPALPEDYALPVLIVVHVPPGRRSELTMLFAAKCRLPVGEGEDKEPILPGTVTFAPPDYHMLVEPGGTISLSRDEQVLFSRPSIDVLFESAADAYGPGLVGVVLTGANEDGAQGLAAVAQAGGMTLVQDPASAYARAMPEAALKACRAARRMSLDGIVAALLAAGTR